MLTPTTVVGITCLYVGFLYFVAVRAERNVAAGRQSRHPLVYALSLTVYCTSWTFYGSVGGAANTGLLFMTIYLGPTLSALLWPTVLRKMVRIKSQHRITSIADFLSARYNRSQSLAALATVVALVGSMPYIALQLRSIKSTFAIIAPATASPLNQLISANVGPLVVALMIVFTIVFGARRIDPTERHEGMMMAIASESAVKLIAFVATGVFATFFLHDGFRDLFAHLSASQHSQMATFAGRTGTSYLTWSTYLLLSTSAFLFLPRQFHVAVVENSNERHIASAMWQLPLYLLVINLFVVPIAGAGVLSGLPATQADTYVLRLPLDAGMPLLALFVFVGGFSAATGMIMISAMTLSTMATNHLVLPLIRSKQKTLHRHKVLQLRWVAVVVCIVCGYGYELQLGDSFKLVGIGIMSFAAALQFAPPILFGILWRRATKKGALAGLFSGFGIWLYTLFVPALIKSSNTAAVWVDEGPLGIGALRPHALFGLEGLPEITHSVFWSLLFNIGLHVLVALTAKQSDEDRDHAIQFITAMEAQGPRRSLEYMAVESPHVVNALTVKARIVRLLSEFFTEQEANQLYQRLSSNAGFKDKRTLSIVEMSELVGEVEKSLAGSFGTAIASRIVAQANLYTEEQTRALKDAFSEILTRMRVKPEELRRRVDYYREKERLHAHHAAELQERVEQRDAEIAERKKMEQALRHAEEKYRSIFENAVDGIFQCTSEGRFFNANPALARIFGHDTPDAFLAAVQGDPTVIFVNPEAWSQLRAALDEKGQVADHELECRRVDRSATWVSINARAVKRDGGSPMFIEGIMLDVSERKQMVEQLRHSATYDQLTGLPNRAFFADHLRQAIARHQRRDDYHYAVLFLDLDRFKYVNDSYGHQVGDHLLRGVSDRLRKCVRGVDTVSRLGGDEFTILLEELGRHNDALAIVNRINEALKEPFAIGALEIFTSTSIGIVFSSNAYRDPEHILRDADTAMYRAKAQGRGYFQVFNEEMHEQALRLLELETSLVRLKDNQDIVVHYQPIVALDSDTIVGIEALCRWNHPVRGLIPPAQFIPIAEEAGLILPIDLQVLTDACRQTRSWQKQYARHASLALSVNISGKHLCHASLAPDIVAVLEQVHFSPQRLTLEVTESVLMKNPETSIEVLKHLRTLGVRVAIDDFGTGFSSLSYLQRLPVDTLKIDRSFINRIGDGDRNTTAIVETIIKLAHTLGITVVAEGVERESQLEVLRQMSCDRVQGFYFSRGLPPQELAVLLQRDHQRWHDDGSDDASERNRPTRMAPEPA